LARVLCYHAHGDKTSAGRDLDGNGDKQSGGDYLATISGSRLTNGGIPFVRTQTQAAAVAEVVDHLLARGQLTELSREPRAGSEGRTAAIRFGIDIGR
jgi:hypothetical protein